MEHLIPSLGQPVTGHITFYGLCRDWFLLGFCCSDQNFIAILSDASVSASFPDFPRDGIVATSCSVYSRLLSLCQATLWFGGILRVPCLHPHVRTVHWNCVISQYPESLPWLHLFWGLLFPLLSWHLLHSDLLLTCKYMWCFHWASEGTDSSSPSCAGTDSKPHPIPRSLLILA